MMSISLQSKFLFVSSENAYEKLKNDLNQYDQWVLLMDENTANLCKTAFLQKLTLIPNLELCISPGERNKNLEVCQELWESMLKKGINRNGALVNLGGGLISDLGGYVASCYKRGIDFYNVPTTLLSMVDAAYGGKTAVNFNGIKNQIGIFKEAKKVLYDTGFLKTLPETQMTSGFAEIIKHALIEDSALWNKIRSTDKNIEQDLDYYIQRSIKVKTAIIEKDPLEHNIRKKLNFGHTVGHAFESLFTKDEQLFHGHAVAAGMICEAHISMKSGLLNESVYKQIETIILKHFGKLNVQGMQDNEILEQMYFDKKNISDALNFTLISDIGSALIDQIVPKELVLESIQYYRQLA